MTRVGGSDALDGRERMTRKEVSVLCVGLLIFTFLDRPINHNFEFVFALDPYKIFLIISSTKVRPTDLLLCTRLRYRCFHCCCCCCYNDRPSSNLLTPGADVAAEASDYKRA